MGAISRTLPIIRMMTGIPHGLTLLFRFLPPAKSLQCGDGSNRSTDNLNYRLSLLCIGAVFKNKHHVTPLVSTLQWQQIRHSHTSHSTISPGKFNLFAFCTKRWRFISRFTDTFVYLGISCRMSPASLRRLSLGLRMGDHRRSSSPFPENKI